MTICMHPSAITLVMLFTILLGGCDTIFDGFDLDRDSELDVHAVYAKNHKWIGKCAKFDLPMAYLTNLPPTHFEHAETVRIGRTLSRADEADYLRQIEKDLVITPVPPGTTFEVIAVFTYVHEGLSRMLVDDVEVAVLRDNHGLTSTHGLYSLMPCK